MKAQPEDLFDLFKQGVNDDDEDPAYKGRLMADQYENCTEDERKLLNYFSIITCGWGMDTLLRGWSAGVIDHNELIFYSDSSIDNLAPTLGMTTKQKQSL